MKSIFRYFSVVLAALLLCSASTRAQCPDYFIFDDSKTINNYNHAVDGIGDINHDGYDDIIYVTENSVVIRSGQTGEILRTIIQGSSPVAGVGDINKDGYDDYVAGGNCGSACIVLYSGIDGAQIHELPYGRSVAGAGDINNDGVLDIIVGDPYRTCWVDGNQRQHARVYVISGASGNPLITLERPCSQFGSDGFGASVAGMGDLNGDGHDDVAIGTPGCDRGGTNQGQVIVYSGAGLDVDILDTIYEWRGNYDNDAFGAIIANAGDVNNDGRDDIIIGRPESSSQARVLDSAWVYSGTGGLLYGLSDGGDHSDRFGLAVDGVGDINHDGYDDFAVGAFRTGNNYGKIYIYSGQDGSLLDIQQGLSTAYSLGRCLAGVGDINNDGVPDIAATAYMKPKLHVFTCIYQSPECQADGGNDSDGRGNMCDNCPDDYNVDQLDSDHDGIGDVCDECTDIDWDGYGNPGFAANTCVEDNCPDINNADQADGDSDGTGDVCDNCPDDYNADQADPDGDGVGTECDNCPENSNETQQDGDSDGVGDLCDNCPNDANEDQANRDDDNYGDICDNCPDVPGGQWDFDNDGIGDICDECVDTDGDGYGTQNGFDAQTCETDNCEDINNSAITIYNPDQSDVDGDGFGDVCDNCPDAYNPSQEDRNYDGRGDSCVTFVTVPEGYDVEVDMGEGVVITFEEILWEGEAEIFITDNDPPVSGAFSLLPGMGATVFNLDYLGYGEGSYTICIDYDDTGMDAETEANVALWHFGYHGDWPDTTSSWLDITTSLDTASNIVCGITDDLSPFAVGIPGCCSNIRGNANADAEDKVNIGDITYLIEYMFGIPPGPEPPCRDEGNANGDAEDKINIGDITYLIDYLFGIPTGPAPPACP